MTTEKMSVHKALCELKIMDDRIRTAMTAKFCYANQHSNEKIGGKPLDEVKKDIQGAFDKASALINRRNAMKRALVLSNAATEVEIGGKKYTVAEAIEMKNHGIENTKAFRQTLASQLSAAQRMVDTKNGDELERRADDFVTAMFAKETAGASSERIKSTRDDFIASQRYELVDPLNISKKIEQLDDEIAAFMADVDSALSTSNALTVIEFEYEG